MRKNIKIFTQVRKEGKEKREEKILKEKAKAKAVSSKINNKNKT
ncbi:hypothetical protein [Melioribacter sp. OK-6-Me]